MAKQYNVWLNIAPDGEIISSVFVLGDPNRPPDNIHTARYDGPHRNEVWKNAGENAYYDGKEVVRKPVVTIEADRAKAAPGEVITVRLPDATRPLRVQVNSQVITVEPNEPLEITSPDTRRVVVKLDEKFANAHPMLLEFSNE